MSPTTANNKGACEGEIYLAKRCGFKDVATMRKAFEVLAKYCDKYGI